MSHELVPIADRDAWDEALADIVHPHAHTHSHVAAFAASSGDQTSLYVHRDDEGITDVACPIAVRGGPDQRDAYTPFGFGGFAAAHPVPTFAAEWQSFAASNGWVASYVFQSPLLDRDLGFADGAFRAAGPCYVLDLTQPTDHLLAGMSSRRRAELRRWSETTPDLTLDKDAVAEFLLAEAEGFFESRGAGSVYRFADATWSSLVAGPTVWCVAACQQGRIVAASVFGESCGMVDYLFGISQQGVASYSAPLIWEAVLHFAGNGSSTLNLGGAIVAGDGVGEFKRRFGARELQFTAGRFVHLPDAYRDLCRRAGVDEDPTGYFPPYRKVRSR